MDCSRILNKSKHLNLQRSIVEALAVSVLSHENLHGSILVGGHAIKDYPGADFVLPNLKYVSPFSIFPPIFDTIVPTNKVYFMEECPLDSTKFMVIYPRHRMETTAKKQPKYGSEALPSAAVIS